jgi:hypothetical protein
VIHPAKGGGRALAQIGLELKRVGSSPPVSDNLVIHPDGLFASGSSVGN